MRQFSASHYRHLRDRRLKRLRKLLSLSDNKGLLEAFWVLDRGRMDASFLGYSDYSYPQEYLKATAGQQGAIHGWEIETLVTELLATGQRKRNRTLNHKVWPAIANIINALRDTEGAEAGLEEQTSIHRTIFRILHRQLPWQMHDWNAADAIRWWTIFDSDLLRSLFENQTGLSLQKFIRMGMAWNVILNGRPFAPYLSADADFRVTTNDVGAFVRTVTDTLSDASAKARRLVQYSTEIGYRRSDLRQKPIISIGHGGSTPFIRPIEQLLFWRITSGLYYDVIAHPQAANEIGFQFENYTRHLLESTFLDITVDGDFDYGTRKHPQRSPDCILHKNNDVQALIECKAKRVSLVVQNALSETRERDTAITELAKGIVQLCQFEEALEGDRVPDWRAEEPPLLILVTLDDWIFTGADIRDPLYSNAREIAISRNVRTLRIDKREIVLCTSTELDQLISTYSYQDFLRIFTKSLEGKYKNYAVTGVARECFSKERRPSNYPLKRDLDALIGL